MVRILLVMMVGASGCLGGGSADDTGPNEACWDLGPQRCEPALGCVNVTGRPLDDDGSGGVCVDFTRDVVPFGCMPVGMDCGQAETLAAPPGDPAGCTWFSTTCVPKGWVGCVADAPECAP